MNTLKANNILISKLLDGLYAWWESVLCFLGCDYNWYYSEM